MYSKHLQYLIVYHEKGWTGWKNGWLLGVGLSLQVLSQFTTNSMHYFLKIQYSVNTPANNFTRWRSHAKLYHFGCNISHRWNILKIKPYCLLSMSVLSLMHAGYHRSGLRKVTGRHIEPYFGTSAIFVHTKRRYIHTQRSLWVYAGMLQTAAGKGFTGTGLRQLSWPW